MGQSVAQTIGSAMQSTGQSALGVKPGDGKSSSPGSTPGGSPDILKGLTNLFTGGAGAGAGAGASAGAGAVPPVPV